MSRIDEITAGTVQRRAAVVEDVDAAKGEILVKAAPYGVDADIGGGIVERFEPGTFARAVKAPDRISLFLGHGGPLVGRAVEVLDQLDGLWIRNRLARTTAAKDMVSLIEDRMLRDCSVEFRAMPQFMRVERLGGDRMKVTHKRAHLVGCAIVTEGAYGEEAFVASVRDAEQDRAKEEALLWLENYRRQAL